MREKYYIEPMPGDYVTPDGWNIGSNLMAGDGPEGSWPGCGFRLPSSGGLLAVNVKVTGNPYRDWEQWKSRCQITFVGDGEPDKVTGGYMWTREIR